MQQIIKKYNLSDAEKREINIVIKNKHGLSLDDINFMIEARQKDGYLYTVFKNDDFRDCTIEILQEIKKGV
tara:strand:+ start:79 stop:291 length:213 start_codon:yes stop_codon:yes gene_type:complete